MLDFTFDAPGALHIEWDGARRLGSLLAARFAARRALLVTDAPLVRLGVIAPRSPRWRRRGFMSPSSTARSPTRRNRWPWAVWRRAGPRGSIW